jgi:hypothetical protein
MKKMVVILTGIVALVLLVPTASANYVQCGAVGSPVGASSLVTTGGLAPTAINGVAGTASINGSTGLATFTCSSIVIPTGYTLTGIDLYLKTDASAPSQVGAGITTTWNTTGGVSMSPSPEVGTNVSADGIGFADCNAVSGQYVGACPAILSFSQNVAAGGSSPLITMTASAVGTNGGVAGNGNVNASLLIQFDETTGAPEPATLSLIGGALLGLGVFGRKKFRRQ